MQTLDLRRALKIDRSTYDKRRVFGPNHGYHLRTPRTAALRGIVLHTTNNAHKGTQFDNEARFLFTSANVSAHFLVGKEGQIVRFLRPDVAVAWHVGHAKRGWSNAETVGIEMHCSVGEDATPVQFQAMTQLVLEISYAYKLDPQHVALHRAVALPAGRKQDANFFEPIEFDNWHHDLVEIHWPEYMNYRTS